MERRKDNRYKTFIQNVMVCSMAGKKDAIKRPISYLFCRMSRTDDIKKSYMHKEKRLRNVDTHQEKQVLSQLFLHNIFLDMDFVGKNNKNLLEGWNNLSLLLRPFSQDRISRVIKCTEFKETQNKHICIYTKYIGLLLPIQIMRRFELV